MTRNTKISIALVSTFIVIVGVIAVVSSGGNDSKTAETAVGPSAPTAAPKDESAAEFKVVASDPRRLGTPGSSGVIFTEFLDFECEACGAAYPAIEQLRKDYAGTVTFQVRYFPLDGHANSRNAAHAVEAAAQQGKFEAMYQRMYETQKSWAEKQTSQAAVFRSYAKDLGLNMRRYDKAVDDPKTHARVERDVQAAQQLGLQGTPSFFINEQQIQPQSLEDLRQQVEAATKGS